MVEKNSKKSALLTLLLLLLLGSGIAAIWIYSGNKKGKYDRWRGKWDVTYYYENHESLQYKGALILNIQGSPSGMFEIFAPYSSRPETLELSGLKFTDNGAGFSGFVVHDQYRINGGFLKEQLECKLESPEKMSGTGRCLEYCAEGTEGARIIWQGVKTEDE